MTCVCACGRARLVLRVRPSVSDNMRPDTPYQVVHVVTHPLHVPPPLHDGRNPQMEHATPTSPCSCRWNLSGQHVPGAAGAFQASAAGRHCHASARDCRYPMHEHMIAFSFLRCPCVVFVCVRVCVNARGCNEHKTTTPH